MLYKKGIRILENWRPISLLNVDYELCAQVLSKRLQNFIGGIISTDQTDFIKKRSATENVRLTQDVIDYCLDKKLPCIIMFLDFKKRTIMLATHFITRFKEVSIEGRLY